MSDLSKVVDRAYVTPDFLMQISKDAPHVLSIIRKTWGGRQETRELGIEGAEEVYRFLRNEYNQRRELKGLPRLTDQEMVEKLRRDKIFYYTKLGLAIADYMIKKLITS